MPAHHIIDSNARLIITTWQGEARDVEFIEAIKTYQNTIQNKDECIFYNEVVNLSGMDGIKLSAEGVKTISQIASNTDRQDVSRKLALIVSTNLAFGLARMYEAYRGFSRKACKEIRVFKDETEAMEWVQK